MTFQFDRQSRPSGDGIYRFLDQAMADLSRGLVSPIIFNDEDIFRHELDQIFSRMWVFIGHEDEVQTPGDYHIRRIGLDSFIYCRDEGGTIRVLFNSCRHRGAQICRAEVGNTSHFRCPYHGWSYSNSGRLVGVPSQKSAYQELDLESWSLISARVATYRGLVFATLADTAPELEDYLGKFRWYLDIQLSLSESGMTIAGPPHRWQVQADWKTGAENFTGDSSHTQMTHRSVLQIGLADSIAAGAPGASHGIHVNDCSGHAISIRRSGEDRQPYFGYPSDLVEVFEASSLSADQRRLAARSVVQDGTIFPNLSFIHMAGKTDRTERASAFLAFRVWQPLAPGRMEIWNWVLVPREASKEYRELAYLAAMSNFSPSGSFEQDDVTVWEGIASTGASQLPRQRNIHFNYQMGMPGMSEVTPMSDWPGPGAAHPSNAGESGLRAFHESWLLAMKGQWPNDGNKSSISSPKVGSK